MKNNKKIGILVVAYNAVNTLTKVLDRIPQTVYDEIDEIAVFDDSSKDNTYMITLGYKQVRNAEKLHIYYNEKNLGYGGNQKKGFKYFIEKGFDAVVLLHGDGQYAPEILNEMYNPIIEGRADVVLGSRMMKEFGGALKGGMPFYKFIGNKILSGYQNFRLSMNLTEFHSGYRAYSTEGLRKINLDNCSDDFHFDTQIIIKANHNNLKIIEVPIPTYYGEEICYVNGMKYAKNIYHTTNDYIKTVSGKNKSEVYSEFYVSYPLKLYPYSSHSTVIKKLNAKKNQRILDVGCGDGLFAKHISEDNNKTGVDFIPPSANMDRNFKEYYQYDLNNGLPSEIKQKEKYDYVLLLDIIEHLIDRDKILDESASVLKPDGRIILSLPNIANIYVRLNLLIGRFPYADKGILDRTHIHFFTLKLIKQLVKKHNLEIERINVSPIPIIEVLPGFLKNNLGKFMNWVLYIKALIMKGLFGYQFILTLKKSI